MRDRRLFSAVVLGALVGGAVARLVGLGRQSYWFDELCSVRAARSPSLIGDLRFGDIHPPLFFALLRAWGTLAGLGEGTARLLPCLFGILAILAAAWLGTELQGRRTGALAAVLTACAPFAIASSRELRSYSLLHALVLGSTAALLVMVRRRRATDALWYVLLGSLLPYTHSYGLLTLAAHGTFALALLGRPATRRDGLRVLGALVVISVVFAPWTPVLWQQTTRWEGHSWLARPDLIAWVRGWWSSGWANRIWVMSLSVAAVIAVGHHVRTRSPRAVLVVALLTFPLVLPLIVSWVARPIFQPGYAIGAWGVFVVCAAEGLGILAPRVGLRVLGATMAVMIAAAVVIVFRESWTAPERESWRTAARWVTTEAGHGTPSVVTRSFLGELLFQEGAPRDAFVVVPQESLVGEDGALERALASTGDPPSFWLLDIRGSASDPEIARVLAHGWCASGPQSWREIRAIRWTRRGREDGAHPHDGRESSPSTGSTRECVDHATMR